MAILTNGECKGLLAQVVQAKPDEISGWFVVAIMNDRTTRIQSNARDIETTRALVVGTVSLLDHMIDG